MSEKVGENHEKQSSHLPRKGTGSGQGGLYVVYSFFMTLPSSFSLNCKEEGWRSRMVYEVRVRNLLQE